MVKSILMVDDDIDDREIFQEVIKKIDSSLQLKFAEDGEQALGILHSETVDPDVIFLDFNMPKLNGLDCLRALKSNKRTQRIPVIIYTTSVDREHEKVALMLGADHCVKKMTNFTDLCAEVNRLLKLLNKH